MPGVQQISMPVTPLPPLSGRIGTTVPKSAERVKEMAREFEATMLATLLKEMRQTLDEGGGFFPGDSGDVQGGLFDQFLSKHLADAGGVGLAAALVRQMSAVTAGAAPDARPRPAAALDRVG